MDFSKFLKLNDKKTQLMCISTKNCIIKTPSTIKLMGEDIKTSSSAKYLGVWLDEKLFMSKQVNHVCAQGYITLRNLWKISSKVNDISIRTQLIHSCLLSKLNFCSILYHSLPKKELKKLDRLLKAGVRFVFRICGADRRQHITPFLQKLHFLPIKYRSEFKINLTVYKCFKNQAPNYLKSLLIPRINESTVVTRLDNDVTWLNSHPIETLNYKCRGFRQAAPVVWNKLDKKIRESPTVETFKSRLKTFYFEKWLKE